MQPQDRSALIRLASTFPAGSDQRKAVLAKVAYETPTVEEVNAMLAHLNIPARVSSVKDKEYTVTTPKHLDTLFHSLKLELRVQYYHGDMLPYLYWNVTFLGGEREAQSPIGRIYVSGNKVVFDRFGGGWESIPRP